MNEFRRTLGPFQGIAMTVTTFIGTGLLVIPAMSLTLAGDFAFDAWLLTILIMAPIAVVFAKLGALYPSSAGAAHYIGIAYGETAEKAVGWLFLSVLLVGPGAAIKISAYYLAIVLDLPQETILTLSLFIILGLTLFGVIGLQTSAKVQSAIVLLMIISVVFLAQQGGLLDTVATIQHPEEANEWLQTMNAIGLIFWCFLGIEVMAHLGAEFKNPKRDFPIAMLGGITIVVLTYLTLVLLLNWHQTFGDEAKDSQSLARLVESILGESASQWFSAGAFLISFANIAVYILGFGRMVQALAEKNALPHYFSTLNTYGAPGKAVVLCCGVCTASLLTSELYGLKLYWLIEMTNGAFLTIYTLSSFAAWSLFRGKTRIVAALSILACVFIASQLGLAMLFATIALASAFLWEHYRRTLVQKAGNR